VVRSRKRPGQGGPLRKSPGNPRRSSPSLPSGAARLLPQEVAPRALISGRCGSSPSALPAEVHRGYAAIAFGANVYDEPTGLHDWGHPCADGDLAVPISADRTQILESASGRQGEGREWPSRLSGISSVEHSGFLFLQSRRFAGEPGWSGPPLLLGLIGALVATQLQTTA
jgi:hypothetical protein